MTAKMKLEKQPTEKVSLLSTDPALQPDAKAITVSSETSAVNGKSPSFEEALSLAQAEVQNAILDKVNPRFNSKYATLASVREAVMPVFTKHGLSIVQCLGCRPDGTPTLVTSLVHSSGQHRDWEFPMPRYDDIQKMASALTYLRRYTMSMLAGIASEEDDDGNQAATADGRGPKTGVQAGFATPKTDGIVL